MAVHSAPLAIELPERLALDESLEESPRLWQALDIFAGSLSEQVEGEPSEEALAAYVSGSLPCDQRERIQDYLTVHPHALVQIESEAMMDDSIEPDIESPPTWAELRFRLRETYPAKVLEPLVEDTEQALRYCTEELHLHAGPLTAQKIHGFVDAQFQWLQELGTMAQLDREPCDFLSRTTLQGSFPVMLFCRLPSYVRAAEHLIQDWRTIADRMALTLPVPRRSLESVGIAPPVQLKPPHLEFDHHALSMFQLAVFEVLRSTDAQLRGLETLLKVQSTLELDLDQLSSMLDSTSNVVSSWLHRKRAIPIETLALLSEVEEAHQRLTQMFLPERLPQVIRRSAELFGNTSALEWIVQGRFRDVANRYELLLRYQG